MWLQILFTKYKFVGWPLNTTLEAFTAIECLSFLDYIETQRTKCTYMYAESRKLPEPILVLDNKIKVLTLE